MRCFWFKKPQAKTFEKLAFVLSRGRPAHVPHEGELPVIDDIANEERLFVELTSRGEQMFIEDQEAQPKQIVALRQVSAI